jgi:hypothetical protein
MLVTILVYPVIIPFMDLFIGLGLGFGLEIPGLPENMIR